ncbi:dihydroorotase [bacterium]|nr:dihydroorotase [bacterium]
MKTFKDGLVFLNGKFVKKDFAIDNNGKITFKISKGVKAEDLKGKKVIPSLFDLHTHTRCPGQEYKEDFDHITKAASHGGFSEICAMPNTKPVADNEAIIDYIVLEAEKFPRCKIYPFGSMTVNLEGKKLSRMGLMKQSGAIGVTDDGMCIQNTSTMVKAMQYASTHDLFIMDHAEDINLSSQGQVNEGETSYKMGYGGIPEIAETTVILRDIELSRYLEIPIHITHVSTKRSAELILKAKADGVQVTFDITPHHLSFTEKDCLGFNTDFKVNPPLRNEKDRKFLVDLVKRGKVDAIATDHAPHAEFEKEFAFNNAPFGISSLDTAFVLLYNTLTIKAKIPLEKWIEFISSKPRNLLKLPQKELKEGVMANFFIFDSEKKWKINADDIFSKGKNNPLIGKILNGKIINTYFRGKKVY